LGVGLNPCEPTLPGWRVHSADPLNTSASPPGPPHCSHLTSERSVSCFCHLTPFLSKFLCNPPIRKEDKTMEHLCTSKGSRSSESYAPCLRSGVENGIGDVT
jgi:hypothetical protein